MNNACSTKPPPPFDVVFDHLLYVGPRRRYAMRIVSRYYREICTDRFVDLCDMLVDDCAATLTALSWPAVENAFLLFAEWRDEAGCASVFKVLNIPADSWDEMLGHVLENLGPVLLAHIFQKSPSLVLRIIENSEASAEARAFSIRAVPVLVAEGHIGRHEVIPIISALFAEEGVHSEGVPLSAIFETCCELHPADFIVFLLTASSKFSSARHAWEKAVLEALDRPLDSVVLDDSPDIAGFNAPTWIKSKEPRSRQRAVLAYLEVTNPDWEHVFRQGKRYPEVTRITVRQLLTTACRDPDAHTSQLTPFSLVCALCLAVDLDDIESGRNLLQILSKGYGTINLLLRSDVQTVIPYVLARLMSSMPWELARLANDFPAHWEGRKAAVLGLSYLVRNCLIDEDLGRELFDTVLYWTSVSDAVETEFGSLVFSECAHLKCMEGSPFLREAQLERSSPLAPSVTTDMLRLMPHEINGVALMRLSRVCTGSPGSSLRLKQYKRLQRALPNPR